MDQSTVLFVDDETDLREALAQGLELAGHRVEAYPNAEGVLDRVSRDFYGVLVTDIRMPKMDGLALMKAAFDIDTAFSVILITGHGDVPLAVEAMRAGAYDFIEKPFPVARLANVVERALEKRRLVLENRVLREQLGDTAGLAARLVGRSPAIERLRAAVQALAATDADVLILGETGAGKEVVARALHEEGVRKDGPFVALNCGALPAEIIESELFGHEQGAFTGASRQRIGKLEHADGGTVFLDEIESMPLELQVKLLRVIENRTIERLGSNKTIELDVRFVAATKVDLEKESAAGRFRRDLYYRLNVVSLDIPPLRDRREDIPLLFHHLAREARARYRREIPGPDAGGDGGADGARMARQRARTSKCRRPFRARRRQDHRRVGDRRGKRGHAAFGARGQVRAGADLRRATPPGGIHQGDLRGARPVAQGALREDEEVRAGEGRSDAGLKAEGEVGKEGKGAPAARLLRWIPGLAMQLRCRPSGMTACVAGLKPNPTSLIPDK